MTEQPMTTWVPPVPADPSQVRLVLISECAAPDPNDNYGAGPGSAFDTSTLEAFAAAGLPVASVAELAERGVHLTVALRTPKESPTVPAAQARAAAPVLAAELDLFDHAVAWMLMGDVAIAVVNQIARSRTGKRAVPAGSTYRLRAGEHRLGGARLFPSYLQAGPAWYVERSKREMVVEDLSTALRLAGILPDGGAGPGCSGAEVEG